MGPPRITRLVPVPRSALGPSVADPWGVRGYDPATLQAVMSHVPSMFVPHGRGGAEAP